MQQQSRDTRAHPRAGAIFAAVFLRFPRDLLGVKSYPKDPPKLEWNVYQPEFTAEIDGICKFR